MVLVSKELESSCIEFEADVYVLYHDTKISQGFRTSIHVGNVYQTVEIIKIKDAVSLYSADCERK